MLDDSNTRLEVMTSGLRHDFLHLQQLQLQSQLLEMGWSLLGKEEVY
jgi:hypothetical protein